MGVETQDASGTTATTVDGITINLVAEGTGVTVDPASITLASGVTAGSATLTGTAIGSATGLTSGTGTVAFINTVASVAASGSPAKSGGSITVTATGKPGATATKKK